MRPISISWLKRPKFRGVHGSLRKQPTFRDATSGFSARRRLRNERRNSILMKRNYAYLGCVIRYRPQGWFSITGICVGRLLDYPNTHCTFFNTDVITTYTPMSWRMLLRRSLGMSLPHSTQAAQTHYINADVTLACERCCVTNGYLQRLVWDQSVFLKRDKKCYVFK